MTQYMGKLIPGWGSVPSLVDVAHELVPAHQQVARVASVRDHALQADQISSTLR